jgi:hypothetical protein
LNCRFLFSGAIFIVPIAGAFVNYFFELFFPTLKFSLCTVRRVGTRKRQKGTVFFLSRFAMVIRCAKYLFGNFINNSYH